MEISSELKQENFIAVDLHVHTPASSCYNEGSCNNSEESYIELLELYRNKNIKILAVTDHNTIKGYKTLLSIKANLENKIACWNELGDIEEVKGKLAQEQLKLKLFEDILVLPGIEFEAYPGIHLLFIFDPTIDLKIIENFLSENGYGEDQQGKETCEISQVSVPVILEKARKLGAITIAAHIDRKKGIFSSLNSGQGKAQVFKSDNLMGMQINNLATLSEVKSLLENKEYKREKPIAFVRCSDFHNLDTDIENNVTYMKLENIDFKSIFNAFMNPIEKMSFTQSPESTEIINQLIEDINTITFKNASDENLTTICKAACALLNHGHGTIIIGINDDKSLIGIRKDTNECEEIVSKILNKIDGSQYLLDYNITTYSYGSGNVLVLNLSSSRNSIYNIDNEVFIFRDKRVILALPYDLVKIGEERFINRFIEIQTINKKKIENIYNDLEIINRFEHNLSLYNKINSNSIMLTEILNVKFIKANANSSFKKILTDLNEGTSDGNLFFVNEIQKPHYDDIYLRCSCRRTNVTLEADFESDLLGDECIVIVPGGASHLIKNNEDYRIINTIPVLMLTIKEKYKNEYCYESIIAWLKSPILLWYMNFMFNTNDIFKSKPLTGIPLIMLECMKPNKEISGIVTKMINREVDFLSRSVVGIDENEQSETQEMKKAKMDEYCDTHNISVGKLALEVEKHIIETLKITDKELELIETWVGKNSMNEIFNYKSQ